MIYYAVMIFFDLGRKTMIFHYFSPLINETSPLGGGIFSEDNGRQSHRGLRGRTGQMAE